MKYYFLSDKGIVRKNNQDNCIVCCPDDNSVFAVVCDGMGGANAGDVASSVAVEAIASRINSAWRKNMSNESVINILTTAIIAANIYVYDKACEDPSLSGMGTTVVAAVIIGDSLVVAHAGDSRAYIYDGKLNCLTKDHSLVQNMVDDGLITEEQAKVHPKKNYITRALGIDVRIDIDFSEFTVSKGDKLLLCTDGLTNYVSEDEIADVLSADDVKDPAVELISAANRNGGGDNITAVVISI